MSWKNTTVSLTLQIKGNAGQEMKKISDQQIQATTKINQQWTQIGSANAKFVQTAKAGTQATVNTARAGENLLRTNRMLEGVLRQQSIQTKLQSQQLKQQQSSAQQMANWMKQTEQSSKRTQQHTQQTTKNMSLLQKGAMVGGAIVGAGMVLQQPIKRTVDYDKDLHYAAQKLSDNTGDWKNTKKWMNTIVVGNAVNGGVERDQSFLAMDALIANGAYNDKNLDKVKSNLAKAHYEAAKSALASGGDILDFAKVGLAAKGRNLDEGRVQAMVIKADDLGSMSAKDLAKVLPAQLGKVAVDKVNGERQVAQLVALNEIAMNTAGDANEAATNVNNFLGKMYSDDTNQRLKKDHSINLPKRYAEGKNQGKTDFDVFSEVVDEIIAKDKNVQDLVAKLAKAKTNDEKKALLETQQAIFEQSGLATILPDMQALMALVASKRYGGGWDVMTQAALTEGAKARDTKYAYNKEELAAYGVNAFDVTQKNAEFETLQGTVGALGEMGTKVAELTAKYPTLVTAMGSAELALKTLAVAAGGAAITQAVTGGKGGGILTKAGGAVKTGGSVVAGAAKFAGPAAAVAGAGAVGYGVGTGIRSAYMTTETGQKFDDWMGENITKTLALFGNDNAKAALDAQAKYDQMIAEQQTNNQYSKELIGSIKTLINVTSQNKPVINMPGSPLMQSMSSNSANEEKRHGAPPAYLMRK